MSGSSVTGSSMAGRTCAYCGSWVGDGQAHWCQKMHPNWTPEWSQATRIDISAPGGPLDRIADALTRIAAALEALGGEE